MTGFYLLDHPNPSRTAKVNPDGRYMGYATRVNPLSGCVVVHTGEGGMDSIGTDTGAENVARYLSGTDRYASYHDLVDSDSVVPCLPWDHTAFHVARSGINSHAYGLSFATSAALWGTNDRWDEAALTLGAKRAGEFIHHMKAEHGVTVPIRRISTADADARKPGFVSHGQLQADRSDPGWDERPIYWDRFLQLLEREQGGIVMAQAEASLDKVQVVGPGRIQVWGWTGTDTRRVAISVDDGKGNRYKIPAGKAFTAKDVRGDLPAHGRSFNITADVPVLSGTVTVSMTTLDGDRWLAPRYGVSPTVVELDPLPATPPTSTVDVARLRQYLTSIDNDLTRARSLI